MLTPRSRSISAAKAFNAIPRSSEISLNASQNSSSRETLVRCPLSVNERFLGLFVINLHLLIAFGNTFGFGPRRTISYKWYRTMIQSYSEY